MSYSGLSILAVVPARGGSKGIPRKNLQKVAGKSLIAHAADCALAVDWIDRAVISTDDKEIAEEARNAELDVPFLRPAELATDQAKSIDMWRHAWLESESYCDTRFDLSVLLEPTSPLRRPEDIETTIKTMVDGGLGSAATVSSTPGHYTPHKTLTVSDRGLIGFYREDGETFSRRQDIPAYYHRNGVCYAARRETILDKGHIIGPDCAAVIIDRDLVNIDTPLDLELADWLLKRP